MKRQLLRNLEGVSLKKYMTLRRTEAGPSLEIVASEDHDTLQPQEPTTKDISRKRKPTWVR